MLKKFCKNSQVFRKINNEYKEIKVFGDLWRHFFYQFVNNFLQLLLCEITGFSTFNVVGLFMIFIL